MDTRQVHTFVAELEALARQRNPAINLIVNEGPRFIIIRERYPTMPPAALNNIYARIEKGTLNVYSQSGKKPRGNLNNPYGGLDLIDPYGVIVNEQKHQRRLDELNAH